jgi:hypothetical protein
MFRSAALTAVALVLGASACFASGDADSLREGASSLVPPDSRVLDRRESNCVELASSPSCVSVYVDPLGRAEDARTRRFVQAAQTKGWHRAGTAVYAGGTRIDLEREGLVAIIHVRGEQLLDRCKSPDRDVRDCADSIRVRIDS